MTNLFTFTEKASEELIDDRIFESVEFDISATDGETYEVPLCITIDVYDTFEGLRFTYKVDTGEAFEILPVNDEGLTTFDLLSNVENTTAFATELLTVLNLEYDYYAMYKIVEWAKSFETIPDELEETPQKVVINDLAETSKLFRKLALAPYLAPTEEEDGTIVACSIPDYLDDGELIVFIEENKLPAFKLTSSFEIRNTINDEVANMHFAFNCGVSYTLSLSTGPVEQYLQDHIENPYEI